MKRYLYAVLPAPDVRALCVPLHEKDAYHVEDWVSKSLSNLLACGYRWIRTDGDWAVFEREDSAPPAPPGQVAPGATLWEVSNRPAQPGNRRRLTVRASSSSAAVEGVKRTLGGTTWYARRLDVLPDSVKADYDFSVP